MYMQSLKYMWHMKKHYMWMSSGYYAQSNKSDIERQVLYDITSTWNLKKRIQIDRNRE